MLSELLHDADMKLFRTRSMSHSTHCIHQLLPHWNLCQWNSALFTACLLSPTATITSKNIHLCYNVFLMEHIAYCMCCCLVCCSLLFYFFIIFFPVMLYYRTHKRFHLFYCISGIVIVCDFVCNLMAFVCHEIKGLLTYLLISSPWFGSIHPAPNYWCSLTSSSPFVPGPCCY